MNNRIRNWVLSASAIALFIVGTPIVQRLAAAVPTMAGSSEQAPRTQEAMETHEAPFHGFKIGDKYFRVVPAGNGSVAVEMFDSDFKLIAANENEATLTFQLPNGDKETLRISVPTKTECSMPEHSSSEDDCCAEGQMMSDEDCPHEEMSGA